jgi:hypothetical protein
VSPPPPPPPLPRPDTLEVKPPSREELKRLQQQWPLVVKRIGESHPALRTDMLDSWPQALTETTCEIGFDPEFAGEINEVKRLGATTVQRAVAAELDRQIRVEFVEASGPVRWSHERKSDEVSESAPTSNLRSWEQNPAVRQVLEIFHGDVRDVQS